MTIPKEDIHAALTRLAEWFPQTFVFEKHLPHRPLKVGIAADILTRRPVLTRRERGPVLGVYAKRVMYLQSLVAGRIDLDGNPASEVSAADAEHAAATLAEILASREAGQALVAASRAARIAKQTPATAAAAPPVAAAVEPPAAKKRPVLRLPAFRQQRG